MKGRTLVGLVVAALLATTAGALRAGLTQNPYAAILTRNAFGLKPPPLKTPEPPTPPAPGVDVFLTGISTVGGAEKVLLQVTDKTPGKKTEYLPPLVEKDVQGRIEVVSIDPDKGAVVIKIDGDEKTLTFEKDAPKSSAATAAVQPRNPYVRAAIPVPPPLPTALAGAPSTVPSRLGVVVGGWNPPGQAASSLPSTPPANWGGGTNRGIRMVPTLPPRSYGQ